VKDVKYTEGTKEYETNSIIGDYNIELTCDIRGILFPINNGIPTDSERSELSSRVMTLPIFKDKEKDANVKDKIEHIQREEEYKLNTAKSKVDKFFPYREDERFVDLQDFDLNAEFDVVAFHKFYYDAILKEEMEYLKKKSFVNNPKLITEKPVTFKNYECIVKYSRPPFPSLVYSIKKKDGEIEYKDERLFENRCRFENTNEDHTDCLGIHKFIKLKFTIANKEYLDCILHTLQHLNNK
jgi:hypothetical protein